MERQGIEPNRLVVEPAGLWAENWLLLTAGDFDAGEYNAMTVAWGSIGTMWHRPFVQVVVRPTRYTYDFMEKFSTFTLSAFDESHRQALQQMGSTSGRDGDKFAKAKLTPAASTAVAAPSVDEAELVLECRKIFYDDMRPEHFLDDEIDSLYPAKDYHRIYFGEIVAVTAAPGKFV